MAAPWATAWPAVLEWAGYDVTREFYINDAGNQIQKFGKSLAIRYLQHYYSAEDYPLPKECYQGADITQLACEFAGIEGDKYAAPCHGCRTRLSMRAKPSAP